MLKKYAARTRFMAQWLAVLVFVLSFFHLTEAVAAKPEAKATVDRATIAIGDTLNLLLEVRGSLIDETPDLSALEADFEIAGTSQSTRLQFINGTADSSKQWTISLAPRRQGKLQIPAFRIGNFRTDPIPVTVTDNASNASQSDVFVEASVDKSDVFVQEQMLLTVRLFHRVPIREGTLPPPKAPNIVVEPLGADSEYDTTRNQVQYHVVERRYALFAQGSGDVVVPPVRFEGKIPDQRGNAQRSFGGIFGNGVFDDPFNLFQSVKTVRAASAPLKLHVRPPPGKADPNIWLPAESVQVTEVWTPDSAQLNVGNPVTRTITLKALGLASAQLPELPAPDLDFANVYPDQSQRADNKSTDGVTGELTQKVAIIPSQTGKYTLPEVRIPWWDTKNNVAREAVIPARVLRIAGGSTQASPPTAKTVPSADSAETPAAAVSIEASQGPAAPVANSTSHSLVHPELWAWTSLGLFLAWVGTLLMWWFDRRRNGAQRTIADQHQTAAELESMKTLKDRFLRACAANDPKQARDFLLQWAGLQWPDDPPRSLGMLANRFSDDVLRAELQVLDSAIYGLSQSAWRGNTLAERAKPAMTRRNSVGQTVNPGLPPLYPSSLGPN